MSKLLKVKQNGKDYFVKTNDKYIYVTDTETGKTFIYTVDEYKAYVEANGSLPAGTINKIDEIAYRALSSAYENNRTITGSVSFPALTSVWTEGLNRAFKGCTGLTGSISFPALTFISNDGLAYAFYNCTGLTGSVEFPALKELNEYGLLYAFEGCTGLTGSISFPALTSIGYEGLNGAFNGCTGITELHFRVDMEDTIKAQAGYISYSDKFGATNATIYFDL